MSAPKYALALLLSVAVPLSGPVFAGEAAAGTASPQVKKIDDDRSLMPLEVKKLMDERKDLLLIDVRSSQEFSEGSLEGARHIPFIDIIERKHSIPKRTPVVLICTIGGRSFAAVQILLESGYRDVYSLDGGLAAWNKARLSTASR
jgi:rhodanese-related sulfurtransferase